MFRPRKNQNQNKNIKSINIKDIIDQRLLLQSTQKTLFIKFGINSTKLDEIISKVQYNNLTEDKKEEFVSLIGGPANFTITKNLIENK
jgi:hypothetical protein